MARIDYEQVGPAYDAARALDLAGLEDWRRAVEAWLPGAGLKILDLGAGTGQFALAFALWFEARVLAVEPAAAMRAAGVHKTAGLTVDYLAAEAAHLPLRDGSCDAAWLSTVIHHIADLEACARELRRVLRPAAPVLIRSAFPGRTSGIRLFRYFPEAASVVETYPTVEDTVAAFEVAGFQFESLQSVRQVSVASLAEFRQRVAHRADTTLKLISDQAFAHGMRRLDEAVAAGEAAGPIVDFLDLLVLR